MVSKPDLRTGPRTDRQGRPLQPSMHGFALRNPWYWERMRWLKKWVVENWSKRYIRAEGPPGEGGNFKPHPENILIETPPIPFVREHERRREVNGLALAEAISSEDVKTGKHHVLIDIDRPCALIPSTSNDHYHLYIQMGSMGDGLDWPDYAELLRALAKAGVIEQGYADVSIRRKATFVRLPWIRKGHEVEDRQRALGWWMEQEGEVDLNAKPVVEPF